MIKAVVFDFDGLIFDTETHEYNVLQEIFKEHDAELSMSVWGKVIGTQAGFDPLAHLEEQVGRKLDREKFKKERQIRFNERIKEEGPLPGVENYIDGARDLGMKIGLASSSHYDWVSSHLTNLGLYDRFDCIKTADDVEKVKPDPALYLEAAKCLGVRPEEALAFEDSAHGAAAAKKAGMYCVVVPNAVTKHLEFGDNIDDCLDSMAELELALLINRLTGQ
ncbi:HAD family hydrolase [Bacillus marinisedimentorum]|uniref:HAD family hydrolase n=1 Tax=Bacillus marinisedimentorum TaxID=1821260 RepID=UPI0007E1E3F7|nr:HAD-IA family hydrolase [Bacillus marinisedimentorum]